MQTIQELADCFFTKYSEEAIKNDVGAGALSSTMYHERLCEQVRQIIEFHVTEALKAASKSDIVVGDMSIGGSKNGKSYRHRSEYDKTSILNSYPLENIK